MDSKLVDIDNTKRQAWMEVLAHGDADQLSELWAALPDSQKPETSFLRTPESGLVMVRGKAGGTGDQFNMGEMTVTRCAVRLNDGTTGVSYLSGRNKQRSVIAATIDAMMQSDAHRDIAATSILEPLKASTVQADELLSRKTDATKVNFFTMVRTREDKK